MEKFDINSLNDEQKKALYETEGVVLVTAGAGSGKTRLLTHRICHLILDKHISPYNILAITFTNKATNEMRERVLSMCDCNIWISTFHSMCVRILRQEIEVLGDYTRNFTIISETDRDKILKEIIKTLNLDEEDLEKKLKEEKNKEIIEFYEEEIKNYKEQKEKDFFEKLVKHLDNIKNKGQEAEEYFNYLMQFGNKDNLKNYYKAVCLYEERLRKSNSLDFDDLLNKTLYIFNNYPEILKKYAERFRYILVDEFQDTNLVQYQLVKLLSSVWGNLFVVGDEDQCIYSWRGANYRNIFNLKDDFKDVKVFKLERNYRSSRNILNLANNVISNNSERLEKNLWTEKDDGLPPVVYTAFDERDEAQFVAREILKLIDEGYSFSDFAILMRINALSRSVEEGLLNYGIPYRLYGGQKFFERSEVKILLAYISIFVNPKDELSLLKVINFPKRGIGDVAILNLKKEAGEKDLLSYLTSEKFQFSKYYSKLKAFVEGYTGLLHDMPALNLEKFAQKVLEVFGIISAYQGKDEDSVNRLSNIDSFLASVKEFEEQNENPTFIDYLASVMLRSDQDDIENGGTVSLATIHAVKGLEFKVVFVIGLEEGIFPLTRANNSKSELEEERRLLYVAITRAEEKIYLTHANRRYMYGKTNNEVESRFVKELNIVEKADKTKVKVKKDDFFLPEKEEEAFVSGLKVGDKVEHTRFGVGIIKEISDDGLVGRIDFEDFGEKELMLNIATLKKMEGKNE